MKGASFGKAPGLTHKHQTKLERLASDKHSSLLRKSVNYGRKKFYGLAPDVNIVLKEFVIDQGAI